MEEKFEIKLGEEILQVILNEAGSYTIYNIDRKVGNITPIVNDAGVLWTTTDLIAQGYLEQIGELIERHYL